MAEVRTIVIGNCFAFSPNFSLNKTVSIPSFTFRLNQIIALYADKLHRCIMVGNFYKECDSSELDSKKEIHDMEG